MQLLQSRVRLYVLYWCKAVAGAVQHMIGAALPAALQSLTNAAIFLLLLLLLPALHQA
jgi:hypothetical protein